MERRSIDLPAGTIHYRESGPERWAAGGVRARLPRRRHAVVRRARAAGRGGVPHLRADLAAGLAHDRHEAGRRPVAARRRPRGRELPRGARPHRRDARGQRHRGSGLASSCSTRTAAGSVGWCSPTATRSTSFPPFPFDPLFRLARHPGRPGAAAADAPDASCATAGSASAGWSAASSTAEESRPWVTPYLTDAGVRRDVTDVRPGLAPRRAGRRRPGWLETSTSRCCSAGRRTTRSSSSSSRKRLLQRSRTRPWSSSAARARSSPSTSPSGWPRRSSLGALASPS